MTSVTDTNPTYGVTRALLESPETIVLNRGRKANADVFKVTTAAGEFVVKDFKKCPWWIRWTYGRLMAGHEYRLMAALADIDGIPQQVFRLDAYAMGMAFLKADTLRDHLRSQEPIPEDYFPALEKLMMQVHARNVSHLDCRNARNVMIDAAGKPILIDFQSGIWMRFLPKCLRNILILADLSGVYKHWYSAAPETMGTARKLTLIRHFKLRRLWVFTGYSWFKMRQPKHSDMRLLAEEEALTKK